MRHDPPMLVVLIHGAYTSPWHWHRLVPYLVEAGCDVVVPELPCDDVEAGIERYVATVEAAVGEPAEEPIVVGSSLGAVTACVYAARHPVRALVTICGLVPRPGGAIAEDIAGAMQPAFAGAIEPNPDGSTTFRPQSAVELVFHESEPELAQEAASRLRRQAALPLTEPCPIESLPGVPRMGIVSGEDRLVRPEWLDGAVRERLGVEPNVLEGDHTPMMSKPDRLAELLLAEPAG
jgi:pimeloyl-ACP methyl ester carboxylesterase